MCLDDCSTDGSYEELLALSKEFNTLRVFQNHKNSGVSFTRNELIRKAKGKYIWFVDPDDMLYPGVVNLAFNAIEERNADVLLGNYLRFAESETPMYSALTSLSIRKSTSSNDYLPKDSKDVPMCAIWAGLFNRDFLLRNNLFFNEKMIAQEDTLFYYQFDLRTSSIYKFEEPCYLYRMRASSVMHSHNAERSLKYFNSMVEMYRVYKEHYDNGDYTDREVLENKLAHMLQNLALCAAGLPQTSMAYNELKHLKEKGLYPYKKSHRFVSSRQPKYMQFLIRNLPNEIDFWLLHILFQIRTKLK